MKKKKKWMKESALAWNTLPIGVCLVLDICVQYHKILWSDERRDFSGIPFIVIGTRLLDWQHGKDRKVLAKMKAKETKAEKKGNLLFVKWELQTIAFRFE